MRFSIHQTYIKKNRVRNQNDHAEISFPYNLFICFWFFFLFGNTIHKFSGIPSSWFNAMTLTSLALAVQTVALILFRLQVPKDHESWKNYFMRNNITSKRSAAFIPVWIFWAYTSVQLHTDSMGKLISLVWPGYQYSTPFQKTSQRHRGFVLKDELNINTRPSFCRMQERPQKLVLGSAKTQHESQNPVFNNGLGLPWH